MKYTLAMRDASGEPATSPPVPEEIAQVVEAMWTGVWEFEPPPPDSVQGESWSWLTDAVEYSSSRAQILIDVRALLTAYAREIADPRPSMANLAAAQGIAISTLRRRYNEDQVEAVRHLIANNGLVDDIIGPFPSLYEAALYKTSPERDRELNARYEMAVLYGQYEIELAKAMGIPIPQNNWLNSRDDRQVAPTPAYPPHGQIDHETLYPGVRRRLLTQYNPHIMDRALSEARPSLHSQWKLWTADM